MAGEAIKIYGAVVDHVDAPSNQILAAAFSQAADIDQDVSNTATRYPLCEVLFVSVSGFTTSNAILQLYRQDVNIMDIVGANVPVPTTLFRSKLVGQLLTLNDGGTGPQTLWADSIPLSGYINRFFIENSTADTIAAGWEMKVRPYTLGPAP